MEHLNNEDIKAIDYYKKFIKEQSLNDNPSSFITVHDQNRFNIIIYELNAHLFSGGSFNSFFEMKVDKTKGDLDQTNLINTIKEYVNEELSKIKKSPLTESFKFEDFQDWELELLKGDPLTFNDLTEEQKIELKGPKGDILSFEDLTEADKLQLVGKKGPKGDNAQIKYRGEHSRPPSKPKGGDIYRDVSINPNRVFLYNELTKKWDLLISDGAYSGTPGGGGLGEHDVIDLINSILPITVFDDETFRIYDNIDQTKQISFQASDITSGNIREITMSDYDMDLTNPLFNSVSATEVTTSSIIATEVSATEVTTVSIIATSAVIGNETPGRFLTFGSNGELQLDTTTFPDYVKGQLSYDPSSLTMVADTGIDGVRLQLGQEEYYLVYNDSGNDISNGKAVFASGANTTYSILTIALADPTFFFTSAQVLGLATHTIPNNTIGLVTRSGIVRDFDTSLLSTGIVYLSTSGDMTLTKPLYPTQRIFMGSTLSAHPTSGSFQVIPNRLIRAPIGGSYSFTSTGILAGLYYKSGFYDYSSTSFTLTQASTTSTYGIVNLSRAAHVGIVADGPGTVDTGQVGLRVTGVLDSESGVQIDAVTTVITDDITSFSLNDYTETSEKYSSQLTFELYVVSGAPTTYSFTFNGGFSKYDDFENRDYTITGLEVTWLGNANSTLDVALKKHGPIGWIFANAGFIPGNGDICRKSIDQQFAGLVGNGVDGAYKRVNLNEFVDGNNLEGHLIEITTGANSTIQTMDLRVNAVSEQIDF